VIRRPVILRRLVRARPRPELARRLGARRLALHRRLPAALVHRRLPAPEPPGSASAVRAGAAPARPPGAGSPQPRRPHAVAPAALPPGRRVAAVAATRWRVVRLPPEIRLLRVPLRLAAHRLPAGRRPAAVGTIPIARLRRPRGGTAVPPARALPRTLAARPQSGAAPPPAAPSPAVRPPTPVPVPVRIEPSVGAPLAPAVRRVMTHRLGFDPGPVRVHTGDAAARTARVLGAAAFTFGRHVFFAPGRFAPRTEQGLRLLAHELTHVRQQPYGRAFAPAELSTAGELALELEARQAGAASARRPAPAAGPAQRALVLAPPALGGRGAPSVALRQEAAGVPVPDQAGTPPAPAEPATAPPDVGALADRVADLLARRTRLEHERGGVQRWN
jgi:hypothetical protein